MPVEDRPEVTEGDALRAARGTPRTRPATVWRRRRHQQAGNRHHHAGLGGDQGLADALGDDLAGGTAAHANGFEGQQHAQHGPEQAEQRGRDHQHLQKGQPTVQVGDLAGLDLAEAPFDVAQRVHLVLRVADQLADAAGPTPGGAPIAFTSRSVALRQPAVVEHDQQVGRGGVHDERQEGQRGHHPAAVGPGVNHLLEDRIKIHDWFGMRSWMVRCRGAGQENVGGTTRGTPLMKPTASLFHAADDALGPAAEERVEQQRGDGHRHARGGADQRLGNARRQQSSDRRCRSSR